MTQHQHQQQQQQQQSQSQQQTHIKVEIIKENEMINIELINNSLLMRIPFGSFGSLVEFKGITRSDLDVSTSSSGSSSSHMSSSSGGGGGGGDTCITTTTTTSKVVALEYTAYAPLARKIMLEIANEAFVRNYDTMDTNNQVHNHNHNNSHNNNNNNNNQNHNNGLLGVAIVHKLGLVEPGQISLYISTYSPHRKLGICALDWIIDAVKERVPVFKKELWEITTTTTTTTTALNNDDGGQVQVVQENRRVEKVWMENKEACCAQKHRNTNTNVNLID